MKYKTENFKMTNSISRITEESSPSYGNWIQGNVVTKHGIVIVYSQGYDKRMFTYTRMDFVYLGRLHIRTWEKSMNKRQCVIWANRFAKDISE